VNKEKLEVCCHTPAKKPAPGLERKVPIKGGKLLNLVLASSNMITDENPV
jgi:hypothetical protein